MFVRVWCVVCNVWGVWGCRCVGVWVCVCILVEDAQKKVSLKEYEQRMNHG